MEVRSGVGQSGITTVTDGVTTVTSATGLTFTGATVTNLGAGNAGVTISGGGIVLKTNGTNNGSQSLLNLAAGTNVTLTDNGSGTVTIAFSGGGGSPSIGGTITSGTAGSVLFVNPTATIAQSNNNFYFQNSATTPTQLGTNTNVALSVNTGGDFTGTDAINTYGQYDAYLPNSVITNSLSGLNTDGAVPAYSISSSRGTGASPSQLQANDLIGGFFGFGAQGAVSPTYQNLGGMAILTTGASTNNLGGELRFYTKADGGSLTQQLSISNAGLATFTGGITSNGAFSSSTAGATTANFSVGSATSILSTATAAYLFGGATNINYRSAFYGITASLLSVNDSYGNVVIASAPMSAAASGTHAVLSNLVVNPIGTVTNSSSIPITNTATVYISGASTAGTNNFAFNVHSGAIGLAESAGTSGQVLTSQGAGATPIWSTISGTGTVTSIVAGTGLTGGTITTTGTIALDLTRANTWTGAQTISTVPLNISGNQSANSWTTNGTQLVVAAATLNDATSTGTVTTEAASAFGIPTITATSSTTFTNYATVYIAGAPVNSTNVTITNKYALFVGGGSSQFNGGGVFNGTLQATILSTTNSPTTANFGTASSSAIASAVSTASLLFGGAANTQSRVYINGNTSTTLTANTSYTNLNVGISPVTIAGSGTHAWLANAVINSIGTVGGSGATVTNTTTLFVGAASSTGTKKYTAYFDTGNIQIANGNLTLGTAGNKINITTGSNASAGTGTLSGGTATINTTAVTASSLIFLTDTTTGSLANVGSLTVGTITAGTSFVVNSTNVLDASSFNWLIIN